MATVIDALIVTLGLDPKGFKKGSAEARGDLKKTREETTKTGKEIEQSAKRSIEGFAGLRREVMALFTVFTAGVGLKQFIEQTIESDAATGRLAHQLDMTVEGLSAWQGVVRRNGGTAADANATFQMLADTLQEIELTGTTSRAGYLQLAGLRASDLTDSNAALLKMSDHLKGMDPQRATAIAKGAGIPAGMIPVLLQGGDALRKMIAEQQRLGVLHKADTEAAIRLQNTLSSLKQAFNMVGVSILTAFAPALDVAAKAITMLGEWAQQNKPIIIGLFLGIAAAATMASIPLAVLIGEALLAAAPFILVGLAIGAFVEAIIKASHWLMQFIRGHKETREAMAEVGRAARELWSALSAAFQPIADLLQPIVGLLKTIGSAIQEAFGGASLQVAKVFVGFLAGQFHALAAMIRLVTALLKGDLSGAMAAAKDYASGEAGSVGIKLPVANAAAARSQALAGPARPAGPVANAAAAAAQMIAGFEGFLGRAKWDRNAFREGFGSDTITDAKTGKVSKVTSGSTVNREDATADLQRRVQSEFMPKVAAAVGGAWLKLSDTTKAALTSIAYNYGRLPRNVLAAARSGDTQAIAAAIRARKSDNGGINAKRRLAEAAAVSASPVANSNLSAANTNRPVPGVAGLTVGAKAQYGATNTTNSMKVETGDIHIHTSEAEAPGIARDIGGELKRRAFVPLANTGLS